MKYLDSKNIKYEDQFNINRKYYDIYIKDLNLIVEVNGDYWHANPKRYNSGDIIKYPGFEKCTDDIWENDFLKYNDVIKNGYNIMYIWECDIRKCLTFEEFDLIFKDIYENGKNNFYR